MCDFFWGGGLYIRGENNIRWTNIQDIDFNVIFNILFMELVSFIGEYDFLM